MPFPDITEIPGPPCFCGKHSCLASWVSGLGFFSVAGGLQQHATLSGTPIRVSSATDLTGGIVGVGYSPRVKPDDFLQVFSKLLQRGGMFYREGSGALTLCYVASGSLIGYVEQHINSWDCLGAIASMPSPSRTIQPRADLVVFIGSLDHGHGRILSRRRGERAGDQA